MIRRKVKLKLDPRNIDQNGKIIGDVSKAFGDANVDIDATGNPKASIDRPEPTTRNTKLEKKAKPIIGKKLDEVDEKYKKAGANVDDPKTALKKIKDWIAKNWPQVIIAAKAVWDALKSTIPGGNPPA